MKNISETLCDAMCIQASHEYKNQQLYLQIATYFDRLKLNNIAKYFYSQSTHEKEHGDKFVQYINSRVGGFYKPYQIDNSQMDFSSYIDCGRKYLEIEQETTQNIEKVYELVNDENSYMDLPFLLEMLKEQVEEEDSAESFMMMIQGVTDIFLFDSSFEG